MQPLATIPSPAEGVWHLGPFPLRAYALMIIAGIVVAVWLGERRWAARGGTPGVVIDVAVWAVPFGLAGGRLYHVVTDWQRYFGADGDPARALRVWEGGLGIWGAIVLGGVGAWIGCRRRGVSVLALGDAIAPGLALAQAIGRWGNWWNQELYGRPLDAWWALEIDPEHRPRIPGTSAIDPRYADIATYHPTFLYESLWCAALALVVIWAGRRFTLTHGRTFALYVAGYTLGRFWIEWLRIDEAHVIAGLRLNDWTSLIVFAGAVAYLWLARNRTSPEAVTVRDDMAPAVPASSPSAEPEKTADAAAPTGAGTAPEEPEPDKTAAAPEPTFETASRTEAAIEPEPASEAVAAAGAVSDEEPEPAPEQATGSVPQETGSQQEEPGAGLEPAAAVAETEPAPVAEAAPVAGAESAETGPEEAAGEPVPEAAARPQAEDAADGKEDEPPSAREEPGSQVAGAAPGNGAEAESDPVSETAPAVGSEPEETVEPVAGAGSEEAGPEPEAAAQEPDGEPASTAGSPTTGEAKPAAAETDPEDVADEPTPEAEDATDGKRDEPDKGGKDVHQAGRPAEPAEDVR